MAPDDEYPDRPGGARVVQRLDGTEERSYGGERAGLHAREWQQRITVNPGDVTAAITSWMVETGRAAEGTKITHLEVRGWKPRN